MKPEALTTLKETIRVLEELEMEYWICCGTLLGLMREGDFIGHDVDIDIGLMDPSRADELTSLMNKRGFRSIYYIGVPTNGLELSFADEYVKVDFFFHYKKDEHVWHSVWTNQQQVQKYYVYEECDMFPLKQMMFRGILVNTPRFPETILRKHYGNWKAPNKEWKWDTDPLCLKDHL